MFIIGTENKENFSRELVIMLKKIEKKFGEIPPHFELLGTINPEILAETFTYIQKLLNHPNINPDLFVFIRLHVAQKESYSYCINFNSNLLKKMGYSEEIITKAKHDISTVPFEPKEKCLATMAIKALYHPDLFSKNDLEELYTYNWSDKDIYDAIDHAGFLLKNGRIISSYLA